RSGAPAVQTYGLTETASQVATLAPAEALRRLGSAGKPLLPAELRILDRAGRPAAAGAVGEIAVRGPMVTTGYAGGDNTPTAAPATFRDGWFHTGDLGYLDREGYLYVVDRRDDLIISGGENVYPAEVEAVLNAHPGVAEAGVAGLPDRRWGQVPAAVVVRQLGPAGEKVDESLLLAYCREHLASYKVPRKILWLARLPRTTLGKLQRRRLPPLFTPDPQGRKTRDDL
ncbi:MAG: AMP-binding protein, partial [Thermaerobacterales bacterium]